jgi:hypothetical protein
LVTDKQQQKKKKKKGRPKGQTNLDNETIRGMVLQE